jgi:hypothetical protein
MVKRFKGVYWGQAIIDAMNSYFAGRGGECSLADIEEGQERKKRHGARKKDFNGAGRLRVVDLLRDKEG